MKKIIISTFFMLMFGLTYLMAKTVGTYKSGKVEVKYRTLDRELTETEIALSKIRHEDGKKVVEYTHLVETRTKKLLGWDVKIDTTSLYTVYENK